MRAGSTIAAICLSSTMAACGQSSSDGAGSGTGASQGPGSSSIETFDAGKAAGSAPAGSLIVDPTNPQQAMDGFGAADTWAPGGALSAAQGQLFFDPENGIGLSILRVGIDVDGTILGGGAAYSDIKLAASYGAIVWGAPWSPPAADKSNDSEIDGGTLLASDYMSWASVLAGFAATVKQQTGVQLYAISAQNEPDFWASYATCLYTPAQMTAFVKVLGPLLAALDPPVQLIAPEPDTWRHLWGSVTNGSGYGSAILADPVASSAVNIIATHDYGLSNPLSPTRPAPPNGMAQRLWETEMSDETAADLDITHGIEVATWVYAAVTTGGASAWHYWWLVNQNTDGEGLLEQTGMAGDINSPPKRLYTLGNFSKFVRPGYVRVDVSGAVPSGTLVAAFQSPSDGTTVIVAINSATSSTTLPVFVAGTAWPAQVVPWVTSGTDNLASQPSIALSNATFTATLAPESVTTFVGKP
jgi:glucuronoarabinoxylan endo-1,4-beta-xylanase